METITQNTEKCNGIYVKILSIMEAVQRLEKDTNVSFGKTDYKALSEEKVTSILRDQMIKQKLIVFPVEMFSHREGQITHVDVKYRIVDTESGQFIEVVSCGDGADTQDKGSGKAMTYAYKYMWLRTFAIPTGEDPDKVSSAQLAAEQKEAKEGIKPKEEPKPKKEKPKEEPKKEEPKKEDNIKYYICHDCGNKITPHSDGKNEYGVMHIANRTKERYGVQLCWDCACKRSSCNG